MVILFFASRNFILYHEFPVSYRENIISTEKINSVTDIFQNTDYYSSHIILKPVDEKVVAYMYYTKTLWNVSPGAWRSRNYNDIDIYEYSDKAKLLEIYLESEEELTIYIQTKEMLYDTLSAVYYFVGDYEKLTQMSDEEFFTAAKDAVLIWEK